MSLRLASFIALAALLNGCAQQPSLPPPSGPFALHSSWLCRPDMEGPCSGDRRITTLMADGASSLETIKPAQNQPIDCFYVYPTISENKSGNSGMVPGPGELRAIEQQFAVFSSVCKTYAPMYRQVTLAGLRAAIGGTPIPIDAELAYSDIAAAWKHYLTYDNKGRGVVLIGHSQGARMLTQLIQREIEGTPVQARLVSAVLAGFNVEVPIGQDVGGTFKKMPVCKSASQTACIISFVSYRATSTPPDNARFGRTRAPGMSVVCTDPVGLSGMPLKTHVAVATNLLGAAPRQADWAPMLAKVDTPFVSLPGLMQAKCVSDGNASYLSVSTHGAADDKRPSTIPGDLQDAAGNLRSDWGWHLVDMSVATSNLLEVVRQQGAAHQKK